LKEEPAMLVFDGHYFYVSNLNNVVLGREKNVVTVRLRPTRLTNSILSTFHLLAS